MAVMPPSNPLWWEILKYYTIDQVWPPDSEDDAYALRDQWKAAATALQAASDQIKTVAGVVPGTWPDAIGQEFAANLTAMAGDQGIAKRIEQMNELAKRADEYGNTLISLKNSIVTEVWVNLALFLALSLIPGAGEAFAAKVVANIAKAIAAAVGRQAAGKVITTTAGILFNASRAALDGAVNAAGTAALNAADGHPGALPLSNVLTYATGGGLGTVLGHPGNALIKRIVGEERVHAQIFLGNLTVNPITSSVAGSIAQGHISPSDLLESYKTNGVTAAVLGSVRGHGTTIAKDVGLGNPIDRSATNFLANHGITPPPNNAPTTTAQDPALAQGHTPPGDSPPPAEVRQAPTTDSGAAAASRADLGGNTSNHDLVNTSSDVHQDPAAVAGGPVGAAGAAGAAGAGSSVGARTVVPAGPGGGAPPTAARVDHDAVAPRASGAEATETGGKSATATPPTTSAEPGSGAAPDARAGTSQANPPANPPASPPPAADSQARPPIAPDSGNPADMSAAGSGHPDPPAAVDRAPDVTPSPTSGHPNAEPGVAAIQHPVPAAEPAPKTAVPPEKPPPADSSRKPDSEPATKNTAPKAEEPAEPTTKTIVPKAAEPAAPKPVPSTEAEPGTASEQAPARQPETPPTVGRETPPAKPEVVDPATPPQEPPRLHPDSTAEPVAKPPAADDAPHPAGKPAPESTADPHQRPDTGTPGDHKPPPVGDQAPIRPDPDATSDDASKQLADGNTSHRLDDGPRPQQRTMEVGRLEPGEVPVVIKGSVGDKNFFNSAYKKLLGVLNRDGGRHPDAIALRARYIPDGTSSPGPRPESTFPAQVGKDGTIVRVPRPALRVDSHGRVEIDKANTTVVHGTPARDPEIIYFENNANPAEDATPAQLAHFGDLADQVRETDPQNGIGKKAREALGEAGTDYLMHVLRARHPGEEIHPLPVSRGAGDFDRAGARKAPDGRTTGTITAEAKSQFSVVPKKSRLGLDGLRYDQGHREYVASVAEETRSTSHESPTGELILNSLGNGTHEHFSVRPVVDADGKPIGIEVTAYDMGAHTLQPGPQRVGPVPVADAHPPAAGPKNPGTLEPAGSGTEPAGPARTAAPVHPYTEETVRLAGNHDAALDASPTDVAQMRQAAAQHDRPKLGEQFAEQQRRLQQEHNPEEEIFRVRIKLSDSYVDLHVRTTANGEIRGTFTIDPIVGRDAASPLPHEQGNQEYVRAMADAIEAQHPTDVEVSSLRPTDNAYESTRPQLSDPDHLAQLLRQSLAENTHEHFEVRPMFDRMTGSPDAMRVRTFGPPEGEPAQPPHTGPDQVGPGRTPHDEASPPHDPMTGTAAKLPHFDGHEHGVNPPVNRGRVAVAALKLLQRASEFAQLKSLRQVADFSGEHPSGSTHLGTYEATFVRDGVEGTFRAVIDVGAVADGHPGRLFAAESSGTAHIRLSAGLAPDPLAVTRTLAHEFRELAKRYSQKYDWAEVDELAVSHGEDAGHGPRPDRPIPGKLTEAQREAIAHFHGRQGELGPLHEAITKTGESDLARRQLLRSAMRAVLEDMKVNADAPRAAQRRALLDPDALAIVQKYAPMPDGEVPGHPTRPSGRTPEDSVNSPHDPSQAPPVRSALRPDPQELPNNTPPVQNEVQRVTVDTWVMRPAQSVADQLPAILEPGPHLQRVDQGDTGPLALIRVYVDQNQRVTVVELAAAGATRPASDGAEYHAGHPEYLNHIASELVVRGDPAGAMLREAIDSGQVARLLVASVRPAGHPVNPHLAEVFQRNEPPRPPALQKMARSVSELTVVTYRPTPPVVEAVVSTRQLHVAAPGETPREHEQRILAELGLDQKTREQGFWVSDHSLEMHKTGSGHTLVELGPRVARTGTDGNEYPPGHPEYLRHIQYVLSEKGSADYEASLRLTVALDIGAINRVHQIEPHETEPGTMVVTTHEIPTQNRVEVATDPAAHPATHRTAEDAAAAAAAHRATTNTLEAATKEITKGKVHIGADLVGGKSPHWKVHRLDQGADFDRYRITGKDVTFTVDVRLGDGPPWTAHPSDETATITLPRTENPDPLAIRRMLGRNLTEINEFFRGNNHLDLLIRDSHPHFSELSKSDLGKLTELHTLDDATRFLRGKKLAAIVHEINALIKDLGLDPSNRAHAALRSMLPPDAAATVSKHSPTELAPSEQSRVMRIDTTTHPLTDQVQNHLETQHGLRPNERVLGKDTSPIQVYIRGGDRFTVVEFAHGDATRTGPDGTVYRPGHPDYLHALADELTRNGEPIGNALHDAIDRGKIDRLHIVEIEPRGEHGEPTIRITTVTPPPHDMRASFVSREFRHPVIPGESRADHLQRILTALDLHEIPRYEQRTEAPHPEDNIQLYRDGEDATIAVVEVAADRPGFMVGQDGNSYPPGHPEYFHSMVRELMEVRENNIAGRLSYASGDDSISRLHLIHSDESDPDSLIVTTYEIPTSQEGGRITGAAAKIDGFSGHDKGVSPTLNKPLIMQVSNRVKDEAAAFADIDALRPVTDPNELAASALPKTGFGEYEATYTRDGQTYTYRFTVDSGHIKSGDPATYEVIPGTRSAVVKLSSGMHPSDLKVTRALAHELRELAKHFSERYKPTEVEELAHRQDTTDNDPDQPFHRLSPAEREAVDHFHGRQGEIGPIHKTIEETSKLRIWQRRALHDQMHSLLESMKLHGHQEEAPRRRALLDQDIDKIVEKYASRRTEPLDQIERAKGLLPSLRTDLRTKFAVDLPAASLIGLVLGRATTALNGMAVGVGAVFHALPAALIDRHLFVLEDRIHRETWDDYYAQVRALENEPYKDELSRLLDPNGDRTPLERPPDVPPKSDPANGNTATAPIRPSRYLPWKTHFARRFFPSFIASDAVGVFANLTGLGSSVVLGSFAVSGVAVTLGVAVDRFRHGREVSDEAMLVDRMARETDEQRQYQEKLLIAKAQEFDDRLSRLLGVEPPVREPIEPPTSLIRDADGQPYVRVDHSGPHETNRPTTLSAGLAEGGGQIARALATFSGDIRDLGLAVARTLSSGLTSALVEHSWYHKEFELKVRQLGFDLDSARAQSQELHWRAVQEVLEHGHRQLDELERLLAERHGTQVAAHDRAEYRMAPEPPADIRPHVGERPPITLGPADYVKKSAASAALSAIVVSLAVFAFQRPDYLAHMAIAASLGETGSSVGAWARKQAEEIAGLSGKPLESVAEREAQRLQAAALARLIHESMVRKVEAFVAATEPTRSAPDIRQLIHAALTPHPDDPGVIMTPDHHRYPEFVKAAVNRERASHFSDPEPTEGVLSRWTALERIDELASRAAMASQHAAATGEERPMVQAKTELAEKVAEYQRMLNDAGISREFAGTMPRKAVYMFWEPAQPHLSLAAADGPVADSQPAGAGQGRAEPAPAGPVRIGPPAPAEPHPPTAPAHPAPDQPPRNFGSLTEHWPNGPLPVRETTTPELTHAPVTPHPRPTEEEPPQQPKLGPPPPTDRPPRNYGSFEERWPSGNTPRPHDTDTPPELTPAPVTPHPHPTEEEPPQQPKLDTPPPTRTPPPADQDTPPNPDRPVDPRNRPPMDFKHWFSPLYQPSPLPPLPTLPTPSPLVAPPQPSQPPTPPPPHNTPHPRPSASPAGHGGDRSDESGAKESAGTGGTGGSGGTGGGSSSSGCGCPPQSGGSGDSCDHSLSYQQAAALLSDQFHALSKAVTRWRGILLPYVPPIDPGYPDYVTACAAHEAMAALADPGRPLETDRLHALDDIVRLADRVRRFTELATETGNTAPLLRARESLAEAIHDYRSRFVAAGQPDPFALMKSPQAVS